MDSMLLPDQAPLWPAWWCQIRHVCGLHGVAVSQSVSRLHLFQPPRADQMSDSVAKSDSLVDCMVVLDQAQLWTAWWSQVRHIVDSIVEPSQAHCGQHGGAK